MAGNRQAWVKKGQRMFKRLDPRANSRAATKPEGIDVARRFIADIRDHPALLDHRNQDGPVQIIDLKVIREALGSKWDAYAEVIHQIAVRTIERHLDDSHSYVRHGDYYVLTYKGAGAHVGADRTRAISLALATYLFGTGKNDPEPMAGRGRPARLHPLPRRGLIGRMVDRFKRALRLSRTRGVPSGQHPTKQGTAAIMIPEAAPGTGPLAAQPPAATSASGDEAIGLRGNSAADGERIESAVHTSALARGDAQGDGVSEQADPQHAPTFTDTVPRHPIRAGSFVPSRLADRAEPSGRAGATAESAAGNPQPSSVAPTAESPAPTRPADDMASSAMAADGGGIDPGEINALEHAMLAAARRLAREGERQFHTPPVRGLHFFYRPMWSVRTNMMAISSCMPIGRLPSGEMVTGTAMIPPGASSDFIQMVDNGALGHVLDDGQRLAEMDYTTLVSIPVHYETLVDRERRAAYLNLCHGLPPRARGRVIFECIGIGQAAGQAELVAGIMALKAYSAMVIGLLPLDAQNFAFWKSAGLSSVGVDIHDQQGSAANSEAELIDHLERFVFLASQSGLHPYVRGLNSLSLAAAAVAAGFDFMEGGIIQDQIEPSAVRPFTLQDLYLQFAAARRAPVSSAF
jgi:hypothetical protein